MGMLSIVFIKYSCENRGNKKNTLHIPEIVSFSELYSETQIIGLKISF